jgi:imidazolonepropionase-like amidohydrolase
VATIVLARTLLDGTGGDPLSDAAIVIEGGRISRVAPQSMIAAGPDDVVIDAADGTIMPGMVDCHCHILYYNGSEFVASSSRSGERTPAEVVGLIAGAIDAARLWLAHGVTTIRDLAAEMNLSLGIRDMVAKGKVVGPRVFASGRALAITGGVRISTENLAIAVDGANEARRATREQIRAGVDLIKLFASAGIGGGEGQSIGESGWAQFTVEEMQASVFEAHKASRTVAAHAISTQSIKNALHAGVDSIEHGNFLDEEGLALMKERGVVLVPTLAISETLAERGQQIGYEPHIAERSVAAVQRSRETIQMARQAGVRIATGTDPVTRDTIQREWDALRRAGLSPMEIVVAATRTGAELLKVQHRLGTLEQGKIADLVVLERNPLEDPAALASIQWVLKEGQPVRTPRQNVTSPTDALVAAMA